MGKVNLYQVSVRNRVYHKYETKNGKKKYMRGQQGRWYSETFIVIANNETEAKRMVHEEIAPRLVLGIKIYKRDLYSREIQIMDIEEIAK